MVGDFVNQKWGDNLNEVIDALKKAFKEDSFRIHKFREETTIIVNKDRIHDFLRWLKNFGFNYLVDVSSSHYPEREEIELHYLIRDLNTRRQIRVKTVLDEKDPRVQTACDIWRGANFMEREVYDLMGVIFEGHPDLRRILMPEDFEGFPLRKDYPLEGDDEWRNFLRPSEGE